MSTILEGVNKPTSFLAIRNQRSSEATASSYHFLDLAFCVLSLPLESG